ncbi:28S ribosomal protein S18c, mitochondrial [Coccinella septempunctata]|uniref:28S ribosomal protein S18c, mitochondrial n=1 Tax=Coccinella septempunctata TaxID=41139 RepID=UPI001D089F11|nr:28S ribosomal protein S18c, mitochondrial [Coccinella septempunctata]
MALLSIKRLPITGLLTNIIRNSSSTLNNDAPSFDMENPFEKEKVTCILCRTGVPVDYKNVKLLSQFQSSYTGRIYGRHITGLCKKQQEIVEREIIKAQTAGLMASYLKHPDFLEDPKLFDVENPIRPHRF